LFMSLQGCFAQNWPMLLLIVACGGSGAAFSEGMAGAGGQEAAATGMQVLYIGESGPSALAVDERSLYWASQTELRRAPLDGGGSPVTLATGRYLRGILLGGDYVYFSDSAADGSRILRVPRTGGQAEQLAVASNAWGMAISDGALFWSDPGNSLETGRIMRANLDGSGAVELAGNVAAPGDIAVGAEFIYFTSTGESCFASSDGGSGCVGGGIWRLPKTGGVAERIHQTSGAGAIVLNQNGLYWPAISPPRVMHASLGGSERELGQVLEDGIGDLRADSSALYWAAQDRVLRMPLDRVGGVVRLVTELDGASAVAVRGDWVYVAESAAGRLLRVATDGSANRPAGPITGPCPAPVSTAEELAATPRADENLELLALSLEPERITATSETYERVVADVSAIRRLEPELAEIGYFPPHDGKTLYLGLTDLAAQSVSAGQYSAWDCLNDVYGLTSITTNDIFGRAYALVELHGIYDIRRLAELYAQLPGVNTAEPDAFGGDGPTLCVKRAGDRYEYVVDQAGGDCPAGCTEHEAHYFVSEAGGQVAAVERWSSLAGQPAPEWFVRICR
jgi:hypothetical protein